MTVRRPTLRAMLLVVAATGGACANIVGISQYDEVACVRDCPDANGDDSASVDVNLDTLQEGGVDAPVDSALDTKSDAAVDALDGDAPDARDAPDAPDADAGHADGG